MPFFVLELLFLANWKSKMAVFVFQFPYFAGSSAFWAVIALELYWRTGNMASTVAVGSPVKRVS